MALFVRQDGVRRRRDGRRQGRRRNATHARPPKFLHRRRGRKLPHRAKPVSRICSKTPRITPRSRKSKTPSASKPSPRNSSSNTRRLFLTSRTHSTSSRRTTEPSAAEFTAKNVSTVDFAKKLMGQIVFLYFLQRKGWLGVPKGRNWGDGPHDFLRRLVRRRVTAATRTSSTTSSNRSFTTRSPPIAATRRGARASSAASRSSTAVCLSRSVITTGARPTSSSRTDCFTNTRAHRRRRHRHGHPRRVRPLQLHGQRSRAAGKGSGHRPRNARQGV